LIGQELIDDAQLVDLPLLQRGVVESAEAFEVRGVAAELGPAVAGAKTTVIHGALDLRPAL
jgi:hypothetical protein